MYIPSAKILIKFDNLSLLDSIGNSFLSVGGDDQSVNILSGGLGYAMKYDQL